MSHKLQDGASNSQAHEDTIDGQLGQALLANGPACARAATILHINHLQKRVYTGFLLGSRSLLGQGMQCGAHRGGKRKVHTEFLLEPVFYEPLFSALQSMPCMAWPRLRVQDQPVVGVAAFCVPNQWQAGVEGGLQATRTLTCSE